MNKENNKFAVMKQDWFKRRIPDRDPITVQRFEVLNFVKKDNAYCDVNVWYSDGSQYFFDARISVNDISLRWTVCGINSTGHSVLLELIEEN